MNKMKKKKHPKKIKSPVIQIPQYNHWSHIIMYPNFCLCIFPVCVCVHVYNFTRLGSFSNIIL